MKQGDFMDSDILNAAAKDWVKFSVWKIGVVFMLVAATGGLWSALLFRQTGAALWFAILIPGVLWIAVQWIFQSASEQVLETTAIAVLVCYAIIGVIWAHRMFLRAQDAQWLGGTISLTGLQSARAQAETVAGRPRGAFTALLRKEIQFQQISLLIAFGILVLHICTLATRKFYTLPGNSELRFALEAVPFLWLLLPWLIGSSAVAEERKLGTHESQLCLPVKRWRQFAVKFCVTVLLGVVLGGIFPWLIENVAVLAHVPSGVIKADSLATSPDAGSALKILCEFAITFVVVSFFASTFTRNTLHALGLAIVFGGATIASYGWLVSESLNNNYYYSLWHGPLIFVIGAPVAGIAAVWLSFSNYKLFQIGGNVWLRNFLVLALSLIFAGIATALIYQRPWELAMTLEPKHGPARLSGPIRPAICAANDRVLALLPDGRLWAATDYHWKELDRFEEEWDSRSRTNRPRRLRVPVPADGVFVGASNWIALAASRTEMVALQSDGSLWRILSSRVTNSWSWNFWLSLTPEPHRIGMGNDWKCVATSLNGFMAIKTDGTLWGWGYNQEGEFAPDFSTNYVSEPMPVGTNSDWAAIFPDSDGVLLMKNDGSIWTWGKSSSETGPRWVFWNTHWNGSDWLTTAHGSSINSSFFLHKDGTLWAQGHVPRVVFGVYNPKRGIGEPTRIGDDSDWTQIAASYWDIVGIKKDGRLVESQRELFSGILGQPSRYSDWIAVDAQWDGLAALAADGTVSFWSVYDRTGGALLGPTHRPLWSLNVLSGLQSEQHPQ